MVFLMNFSLLSLIETQKIYDALDFQEKITSFKKKSHVKTQNEKTDFKNLT